MKRMLASARRVRGLWLLAAAILGAPAYAQVDLPQVVTPLRVDSERNGVNVLDGKITIPVPVLSVPGAPNLRFDRVQNATPYVSGKFSGAGGTYATYSVHTGTGSSEGFECNASDPCSSVTGTGSTLLGTGPFSFRQAGSGAVYTYNLKHIRTTANAPNTLLYYASQVTYPSGETLTYAYDTATIPGDTLSRTFYRPNRITSNLGFFITISYRGSQVGVDDWGGVSQATIYASANPTVALGRLSYATVGGVEQITDIGGRVFRCQGCANRLGTDMQASAGSLTLPGEPSPTLTVTSLPTSPHVGSVAKDGVVWTYAYTNLRNSTSLPLSLYDRLTVTGPNGYGVAYHMLNRFERNVISKITDSIARETTYEFDIAYRATRVAYPEGNSANVTYDSFGNVVSRTMTAKPGSGLATIAETAYYNPVGCDVHTTGPLCYRPQWYRDARVHQSDFVYNSAGQLTQRTDPPDSDGVRRRTVIEYVTAPNGLKRKSVVRICGDVTTCGTSAEIRTEYEYWGNTLLPTVERRIDAARAETLETRYTYDGAGRVLSEDGPLLGADDARYFRYDVHGRRTWEIGPLGANGFRNARRFSYRDSDDKVAATEEGTVTDPASPTLAVYTRTDVTYDSRRNPVAEVVSGGGTNYTLVQRSFDDQGRLECEVRRMNPAAFGAPPGACSLGASGAFGADRITRNVYDAAGQLLIVQRAYGTALQQNYATYTYTLNGQQASVTDAKGNRTEWRYDGHDRQNRWVFPSPTTAGAVNESDFESYEYDPAGNRTALRKRDTKVLGFTYDALNRVTLKTVPASASGAAGYSVHYRYDVQGAQLYARFGSTSGAGITNTYDGFGRLRTSTSTMGGFARTLTSDYDAGSRRTKLTYPDGQFFTTTYDGAGRAGSILESGATTIAQFNYDALGRRADKLVSNAITSTTYDAISRLSTLTNNLAGTSADLTATFGYNAASQIVSHNETNEAYRSTADSPARSYSVNGLNQYSSVGGAAHAYDANGNLTSIGSAQTYVYDVENKLTAASGAKSATLSYDPLGRLFQVESGSNTIQLLYDGPRMVAEYHGAGALAHRYVHGTGVDEPLVWYEGATLATPQALVANHQGSVVAIPHPSDGSVKINAYDAFGVPNPGNLGRFQYTGQTWLSSIELYYYKARLYDPRLGRFLQTDPIGYRDNLNLYAYTYNDPINLADPSGECPVCIPLAIFVAKEIAGEAFEQATGLPAPTVKGVGKAISEQAAKQAVKSTRQLRGGSNFRQARAERIEEAGGKCEYCQRNDATQGDHAKSLNSFKNDVNEGRMTVAEARAAANSKENIVASCEKCNVVDKGIKDLGPGKGQYNPEAANPRIIELFDLKRK